MFSTRLNIPIPSAGTIFLAGFVGLSWPRWRFFGFAELVFELLSFLGVRAEEVRLIDGLTNLGEMPVIELERSRPAANASREVVERWLLDGLM